MDTPSEIRYIVRIAHSIRFNAITADAADWLVTQWDKATASATASFGQLGIDIGNVWAVVQDMTKGVINSIIGLFVGAYKTVVLAWDNLPASFELLGKSAVIALVDMIEKGINKVIELIKMPIDLISKASKAFGGEGFDTSGWKVNLGDFKPELSKQAQDVGQSISQAFSESINTDYVGNAMNAVGKYIEDAALRGRERRLKEASENQTTGPSTRKAISDAETAGGGGKKNKGKNKQDKKEKKSSANSADDWLSYMSELERANTDGLAKIALEQERSMREMLEKAKKAGASHADIEKAKMLITERYAKERMEIAEKYVSSLKFERELKEQIKEIDQLQKLGLISTEQAGNPLSYGEIEAWNRLFQHHIQQWEIKVIKQLDLIYLNVQQAE